MIKKECMTTEWIKSISVRNKYKDLNHQGNVPVGDAEIVRLSFLL